MTTVRPEFGKPETGQARHWFRTDRQMARHYMSPEAREVERQRISERRKQMKQYRAEEAKRPKPHDHAICWSCHGGLTDVGIHSGKTDSYDRSEAETLTCCLCFKTVKLDAHKGGTAQWGPNRSAFVCRVDHPESESIELEAEPIAALVTPRSAQP